MAICRKHKNEYQILLCQQRVTYEFIEFVFARYNVLDINKLAALFNKMTNHEKLLILSFDFDKLWWHINLHNIKSNDYLAKKEQYEIMVNQKKTLLISLIEGSVNKELQWEIPKGRSNNKEKSLEVAMRETEEEVKIEPNCYNILTFKSPIKCFIEDYGIKYHMHYYIADYTSPYTLNPKFKDKHKVEINNTKWWTLDQIKYCDHIFMKSALIQILQTYIELVN